MTVLDQFLLDGRVALVTGAGSGIGEAFAQAMAEAGADVVCVDIVRSRAEQSAAQVRELGRRALAVTADVSIEADAVRMVKSAVEELGTVDIAFANAAVTNEVAPLIESTMAHWRLDIDVNLTSVYLTAREAAKVMVPKRRGKIITTSSIMGFRAASAPGRGQWYSAAKAAVINLTRALGVELAEHNIQVNGIAPTHTRTGMFQQALSGPDIERVIGRSPIGRIAEPHEYKGVAVFLASAASDLMTGFTVAVDGGYLAW